MPLLMAFYLKLVVNKSTLSVENSTAADHVTSIFRVSKVLRDCKNNNKDKKKEKKKRKRKKASDLSRALKSHLT